MKYPEDMLYNRALSRLARRLFADVIGTSYIEGEIREAIECEKQLPQAECVEITPEKPQECVDLPPTEKISAEQLATVLDLSQQIDATCKATMEAYLLETYQISNYEDIPQKAFVSCLKGMRNNIEMQKNNRKPQAA
jgi:hypothetical protein